MYLRSYRYCNEETYGGEEKAWTTGQDGERLGPLACVDVQIGDLGLGLSTGEAPLFRHGRYASTC